MPRVRNPNSTKPVPARPDHIFLLLAEDVTSDEARAIRSKIVRASISARSFFTEVNDDQDVATFNAIIKVPLAARRRRKASEATGPTQG